ncbi:hypothetical protein CXG81DRAFT_25947 [Caulochytrium protostelioides]|uniref:Glucose-6-phosphate 1-dehydrogenase n=1 Tax=Caulochytrium protostelioides TaxID=1555241 RepID=A0A4P9WXT4_9FUNG|nr:glucose-6-phosphate dehydrogenase [Caulochytrium protostelioides]RKP01398.1 hypothetical protein CXG81DRAFT_25947 [Caulochytrium protostelioides]|eukprot:RKP01398.1 hypothetical protein CXG81DRAFT_25947 [Caulochytrium protostelioides]
MAPFSPKDSDFCSIVVFGASGDLAYKKTFPALFGLFKNEFLPPQIQIIGYARSKMAHDDFIQRVTQKIKAESDEDKAAFKKFVGLLSYVQGKYDEADSYKNLAKAIAKNEKTGQISRIFYMAIPPSVFTDAANNIKAHCYLKDAKAENRLVVEKPFGKDSESSRALAQDLAKNWSEEEIYRIDHYLGKEMVKNLMVLRFANVLFGAVWHRHYIHNVQISFKEKFGTEGRGGYFDEFGILRDVMQNHMMQILCHFAMERPSSLSASDIHDEKVKVLRAISPLRQDDVLLGQYTAGTVDGQSQPGYLDDDGVPNDSQTPTFAAAAFHIHNERWEGVPFILRAGKALNETKTEIRVQFADVAGNIFPCANGKKAPARNELVIRVQPKEAVYMKFMNKKPGLSQEAVETELDLNYDSRYADVKIPDAYEALLLDVMRGDHANFVRNDELKAAWAIFTPLLHQIDRGEIKPAKYAFGSRGPDGLDAFVERHGFLRSTSYQWTPPKI